MRRNALPPNDIQHMKFKASASFFADSGVVPFREGWRPVALGDANPHRMTQRQKQGKKRHWPFCEGWRPVSNGTATLTEWPMPFFDFPDFGDVPFCVGWRRF